MKAVKKSLRKLGPKKKTKSEMDKEILETLLWKEDLSKITKGIVASGDVPLKASRKSLPAKPKKKPKKKATFKKKRKTRGTGSIKRG